jgi:hypothetical protein
MVYFLSGIILLIVFQINSIINTLKENHMKILDLIKEEKVIDPKTGKPCWKGYKRHPTIKSGKGSCVKDKKDDDNK